MCVAPYPKESFHKTVNKHTSSYLAMHQRGPSRGAWPKCSVYMNQEHFVTATGGKSCLPHRRSKESRACRLLQCLASPPLRGPSLSQVHGRRQQMGRGTGIVERTSAQESGIGSLFSTVTGAQLLETIHLPYVTLAISCKNPLYPPSPLPPELQQKGQGNFPPL